ncbi:hypothetical protein [Lentzea tibetensis]|uniref:hypothetical protein n=1 Tax=Lentzea tibetensis TaxID=2591470 RepID=UPI001647B803|nr:hypothetical protein [Lentzea tibetensis]
MLAAGGVVRGGFVCGCPAHDMGGATGSASRATGGITGPVDFTGPTGPGGGVAAPGAGGSAVGPSFTTVTVTTRSGTSALAFPATVAPAPGVR